MMIDTYMVFYVHVSFVASRSGYRGEGDARRAYGAFIDGIASIGLQDTIFLGMSDHR